MCTAQFCSIHFSQYLPAVELHSTSDQALCTPQYSQVGELGSLLSGWSRDHPVSVAVQCGVLDTTEGSGCPKSRLAGSAVGGCKRSVRFVHNNEENKKFGHKGQVLRCCRRTVGGGGTLVGGWEAYQWGDSLAKGGGTCKGVKQRSSPIGDPILVENSEVKGIRREPKRLCPDSRTHVFLTEQMLQFRNSWQSKQARFCFPQPRITFHTNLSLFIHTHRGIPVPIHSEHEVDMHFNGSSFAQFGNANFSPVS